jgi:ATP-dependent DNA ligase
VGITRPAGWLASASRRNSPSKQVLAWKPFTTASMTTTASMAMTMTSSPFARVICSKAPANWVWGIVSKRAAAPYLSRQSKFWLKIKNTVESELILLGTDRDNEGKPIAYLGRQAEGELQFAGTAFLTLAGKPRDELQKRIEKLLTNKPPVPQRTWRKPLWVKPELRLRVRHLAGGDTLRHASVKGLAEGD